MQVLANGLRYLRWGGDGEAVQPEKWKGVENCLGWPQNPQRQVHALLARTGASNPRRLKTKTQTFSDLILHVPQFFTSPTLLKLKLRNYQNAKAEDLPKPWLKTDFAKNLLCQKKWTWRKSLTQTYQNFCWKIVADFRNLILPKETLARTNGLCKMKLLACQTLAKNL